MQNSLTGLLMSGRGSKRRVSDMNELFKDREGLAVRLANLAGLRWHEIERQPQAALFGRGGPPDRLARENKGAWMRRV